jgi:hypothetical protein
VVEAIFQTIARYPDARVLATAPSNIAADILAQRLAYEADLQPDHPASARLASRGVPVPVSRAFPSLTRSILAEIYLRRACSCQAILSQRRRRGRRGCVPPLGEPNGCLS